MQWTLRKWPLSWHKTKKNPSNHMSEEKSILSLGTCDVRGMLMQHAVSELTSLADSCCFCAPAHESDANGVCETAKQLWDEKTPLEISSALVSFLKTQTSKRRVNVTKASCSLKMFLQKREPARSRFIYCSLKQALQSKVMLYNWSYVEHVTAALWRETSPSHCWFLGNVRSLSPIYLFIVNLSTYS